MISFLKFNRILLVEVRTTPMYECLLNRVRHVFPNPFDLIHHRFSLKDSNKENEQNRMKKKNSTVREDKKIL